MWQSILGTLSDLAVMSTSPIVDQPKGKWVEPEPARDFNKRVIMLKLELRSISILSPPPQATPVHQQHVPSWICRAWRRKFKRLHIVPKSKPHSSGALLRLNKCPRLTIPSSTAAKNNFFWGRRTHRRDKLRGLKFRCCLCRESRSKESKSSKWKQQWERQQWTWHHGHVSSRRRRSAPAGGDYYYYCILLVHQQVEIVIIIVYY